MVWVAFVLIFLRFTFVANFSATSRIVIQELILLLSVLLINVLFLKQKVRWRLESSIKETLLIIVPIFFFLMVDILVSLGQSSLEILKAGGIALIVSFFEEYYFRGIIFSKINFYLNQEKATYIGVIKSCLLSGLIFGVFHFVNIFHQSFYITTLQVTQVTCLGLVLCAMYIRSKSILLPIAFHSTIDFIGFVRNGLSADVQLSLKGCLTVSMFYIVIAFLMLTIRKKNTIK